MQDLWEESASAKALRQNHAWAMFEELRNSWKACIPGAE